MKLGGLAVLALVLAGCLQTPGVECADGRLCPSGTICDDQLERCLFPGQIEACVELQLARALAHAEPARARELATGARQRLIAVAVPEDPSQLAEIDAWLAAHPAAAAP